MSSAWAGGYKFIYLFIFKNLVAIKFSGYKLVLDTGNRIDIKRYIHIILNYLNKLCLKRASLRLPPIMFSSLQSQNSIFITFVPREHLAFTYLLICLIKDIDDTVIYGFPTTILLSKISLLLSCCWINENLLLQHNIIPCSAQVLYDQPWSTAIFLFKLMHTLHLHKPYTHFFFLFVAKKAVSMILTCAGIGQNTSKIGCIFTFCETAPNLKFGTCRMNQLSALGSF